MFTGEYHHTIDDKNRLAIPVPLRDSIDVKTDGKGYFVTRGLDECLFMYTPIEWQKVVSRIEQISLQIKRRVNSSAFFF